MNRSEIITHLSKVYDDLFDVVGRFKDSYIAGGAIASLALDEPVKDYDIWFHDIESFNAAVVQVQAAYFKQLVHSDEVKVRLTLIAETRFALTFTLNGLVYQLVKSRVGPASDVVKTFDFEHAQAYFYQESPHTSAFENPELCADTGFMKTKVINFTGDLAHPTHTLSRLQKFAKRGYTVPDSTLADLIVAIRNADADVIDRDIQNVRENDDADSYDKAAA